MSSADLSLARAVLPAWGFGSEASVRLVNVSENSTFEVVEGDRVAMLRLHRHGYHDSTEIDSELRWMSRLQADVGLRVPTALPTTGGQLIETIPDDLGRQRHVVLFDRLPGVEPAPDELQTYLPVIGRLTALMHEHARAWRRPEWFRRFRWDAESILGEQARWGRWQDGLGVAGDERVLLGRAADLVRRRLDEFGCGDDRFGLVHADMRLANLLVDAGAECPRADHPGGEQLGGQSAPRCADGGSADDFDRVAVLDFDDSGFCWYLFDFAATVSFIEHDPRLPAWWRAWLSGYRQVALLDEETLSMAATFVMLRRLMLVAWLGSHHDLEIARQLGSRFTADSCALARDYVAHTGWSREVSP